MEETSIMKKISLSPFAHNGNTVQKAMLDVLIALLPAVAASIYFFGMRALILLVVTVASAAIFEWIARKIMKRENSLPDGSAFVTGVLLTLTLPATTPLPIAIIGSFVAIVLVKQLFGGLGCNIFNPAIAARGFLLVSFSAALTNWIAPQTLSNGVDAVASATPLTIVKEMFKLLTAGDNSGAVEMANKALADPAGIWALVMGNTAGSLGETSVIALIIGGIYLGVRKRIHLEIPLLYIGTCFVIALVFGLANGLGIIFPVLHILSGGLFLGAIFMATDWVTKPLTKKGRIVYAIALGVITMIIRLKGNYPEGVLFAILIMNMFVPLFDRHLKSRIFGKEKKKKKGGNENEGIA